MKTFPAPTFLELIETIQQMRVISFTYHGKKRIVEPQCYGIATTGNESLRGYEPTRVGPGTKEPLYTLAEVSGLTVLNQHFHEPGPNYTENDKAMVHIFAQLKPKKKL